MKKIFLILILSWFLLFRRTEVVAAEIAKNDPVDRLQYKAELVMKMTVRTLKRFKEECADPSVKAGDCLVRLGLDKNVNQPSSLKCNSKNVNADDPPDLGGQELVCILLCSTGVGDVIEECHCDPLPPDPPPEPCPDKVYCFERPDCPDCTDICDELCDIGEGGTLCPCQSLPPA